jgi:hypothetical protein
MVIFSSGVLAQDSPVDIIDIDDQHGEGYTREVSANGSSIYHWTLFNNDPQNYTYDITIQTDNSNSDWSLQLNPSTTISLIPGDTESITLSIFSPAGKTKGSTKVTLTFIIELNGNPLRRELRETFTSLEPVDEGEEKLVFNMFENPFPDTFLDNIWGVFLLTVLIWLGISFLLILILDPCVKAVTKKTKTQVDDIILRIIRKPLLVLVFFYGVVSSLRILEKQIPKVLIDLHTNYSRIYLFITVNYWLKKLPPISIT